MPTGLANLGGLIPMILVLVLMYFMMIRPQQKQAKQRQEMLNAIQVGYEVVTIGGLHGVVTAVDEKTVRLKVSPSVELTFNRTAIGSVRNKD